MTIKRAGLSAGAWLPVFMALFFPVPAFSAVTPRARVTVVQEKGVWWFRDAEGKRFFSLGACCTGGCCGHWEENPMEPARKQWMLGLLKKWGFNTAAAWSSPSVWDSLYIAEQIYPPFAPKDLDVFNPKDWAKDFVLNGLRAEVSAMKGRPNLIGYFIDNEPKWEPEKVFRQYRKLGPDSPGGRTLVDFSRKYYKADIKALNREWGLKFTGFSDITGKAGKAIQVVKLPEGYLLGWRNEVAGMYYRRYAALVRQLDPGCLILGERNAGAPDDGFIRAVAPSFDVISINDYNRYGTLRNDYPRMYAASGKPFMITEWSFSGWPRPGLESLQFIDVYTQENRAKGYRKYVREAAKAPFMIGMHWFLWSDYGPWREAAAALANPGTTGGEDDQEAYYPDKNMGLVSTDEKEVYEVLVAECTRTNSEVESLHAASAGWKPVPETPPEKREMARLSPVLDGVLAEWPQSSAVAPVISESLDENPPFRHTYYIGWNPGGLAVAGDISDSRIDFPSRDWAWEGDYLGVMLEFTRSGGGESTSYFQLYPTGGGDDGQQPYAAAWWGAGTGDPVRAVMKPKPGGYTIEAVFPPECVPGLPLAQGEKMRVSFGYRDVSGIYETHWAGDFTLK